MQLPELQPAFQLPKQILVSMPQQYPSAYGKPKAKAMNAKRKSAKVGRKETANRR